MINVLHICLNSQTVELIFPSLCYLDINGFQLTDFLVLISVLRTCLVQYLWTSKNEINYQLSFFLACSVQSFFNYHYLVVIDSHSLLFPFLLKWQNLFLVIIVTIFFSFHELKCWTKRSTNTIYFIIISLLLLHPLPIWYLEPTKH